MGWTVQGSNPGGGEIFRTRPEWPWDPPSLLYNGYRVFPGGKAAVNCRWPPTPSGADVKERVGLYLHSPFRPSWSVLGWILLYYYYYYYSICLSLVTGIFFLVLLLKQRWSPPLRFQASHCSTSRIIYDFLSHHHHHHHHHKHQELDPLIRSVSRVTASRTNASSVFQLFSFLVVCSGMIWKGFGFVAFFASVKASSVCICLSCLVWIQTKLAFTLAKYGCLL